jgi:hypothetical protein
MYTVPSDMAKGKKRKQSLKLYMHVRAHVTIPGAFFVGLAASSRSTSTSVIEHPSQQLSRAQSRIQTPSRSTPSTHVSSISKSRDNGIRRLLRGRRQLILRQKLLQPRHIQQHHKSSLLVVLSRIPYAIRLGVSRADPKGHRRAAQCSKRKVVDRQRQHELFRKMRDGAWDQSERRRAKVSDRLHGEVHRRLEHDESDLHGEAAEGKCCHGSPGWPAWWEGAVLRRGMALGSRRYMRAHGNLVEDDR